MHNRWFCFISLWGGDTWCPVITCSYMVLITFRARNESCSRPVSKACRERLRREKLNDRHQFFLFISWKKEFQNSLFDLGTVKILDLNTFYIRSWYFLSESISLHNSWCFCTLCFQEYVKISFYTPNYHYSNMTTKLPKFSFGPNLM